jgi:hypothetical protein
MSRSRLAVALLLVSLAALVAACNIGPQPLPPGAGDETDPTSARSDAGASGVITDGQDAGAGSPAAFADGSAPPGADAGPSDGGAAMDAGPDAEVDAADGAAVSNDL